MLRVLVSAMGLLVALAQTGTTAACPSCAVGVEARARVWSEDFERNLLLALTPFLIPLAVSIWASRLGHPHARGAGSRPSRSRPMKPFRG